MGIPALLLVLVGFVIYEQKTSQLPEKQKVINYVTIFLFSPYL